MLHHQRSPEHREAVRLVWKSRHVPFGTMIIGVFLIACTASTVLSVWTLGPANPLP
jgi:hypothetical protein